MRDEPHEDLAAEPTDMADAERLDALAAILASAAERLRSLRLEMAAEVRLGLEHRAAEFRARSMKS